MGKKSSVEFTFVLTPENFLKSQWGTFYKRRDFIVGFVAQNYLK